MHLKYKAETWDDLIGNSHIKKALQDYDFNSPLMFEGEKGCGKSSLANILINEFGVDKNNVKIINCGQFADVKTTREEISNLNTPTIFGADKVLVLDEAHMLSKVAQGAWLVALENLRKGVLVFACTTATNTLIETFLRRFIRFKVSPLSYEESLELVNNICKKEEITLKKWIKVLVIEKSQGIPGLILTALPKVKNVEDEEEANKLLDMNMMQHLDYSASNLLKYLTTNAEWVTVKREINKLLKEYSGDRIKADLMNLIAYRINSMNNLNYKTCDMLCKMFDMINESHSILEKAELYILTYKLFRIAGGL